MYMPVLEINLSKLRDNARHEKDLLTQHGIEVMAVNKVFDGCVETAQAVVDGGINVIAESRTYNLKKIRETGCTTCLLRSPCLSEIEEVVTYADISLNSEPVVIQALSEEAVRQGKIHQVLLMVDMGDLREGIWFSEYGHILETIKLIKSLPGLALYGMGTNFNCYGTVLPTTKNGKDFLSLVKRVEVDAELTVRRLSAGNCTSYHLVDKGLWPQGLNHLRIGGLHEFGIEYVEMKYLDKFHHSSKDVALACSDMYLLHAEIIELNSKPTAPVGELGVDAFLQPKSFIDRGVRKRALLAFGRQDVPAENCVPQDNAITVLGQTSDHTLVDIEDTKQSLKVGDIISFELDYTGLLMACQTKGVQLRFIR
ncbi:alanine/ornithine racemase family PLP-dependent enzyme [Klebsiella quasipneumoniae subsp. similipneumoniae]|uniref:alanine/ornithine racemase family PLP-dependent enzyme n=1 Tax=Klebsiella quasipneumoniae TaxID=1463165 RepID=UPI000F08A558|nr:alanine/ornithine racemase family PLP-dependent enzyme [Klebsiella quasipneumoniae]RND22710.1 alanine/ornithine racemase family PLP-dependent enzyme [Klebsiella quasipneumoniae subsp. similipneumoniae]